MFSVLRSLIAEGDLSSLHGIRIVSCGQLKTHHCFSLDLHSTHQTQHSPSETCGYSIRGLWKLNIEMCLDDSCQLSFLPSYSHQSDVRTYVHNFLTDYNSTHQAQYFSIWSPTSASKFTKPAAKGDPKAILSHHKIYHTEMCFRWFSITLALGAICHNVQIGF